MKSLLHRVECDGIEITGQHIIKLSPEETELSDCELHHIAEYWLLSGQLEAQGCDIDFLGLRRSRWNASWVSIGYAALTMTEMDYNHILLELLWEQNPAA